MTEFLLDYGWFVWAYLALSYVVVGLVACEARHAPAPPPRWQAAALWALAPATALVLLAVVVAGGLYLAAEAVVKG